MQGGRYRAGLGPEGGAVLGTMIGGPVGTVVGGVVGGFLGVLGFGAVFD